MSAFLSCAARARRSCSSRPSRVSASGAGRSSAFSRARDPLESACSRRRRAARVRRPLRRGRRGAGALPRSAARGPAAVRRRRRWPVRLRPRAHGRAASGEPNPDDARPPDLALMVSTCCSRSTTCATRSRCWPTCSSTTGRPRARYAEAVAAIADVRERLAAPVPRADAGVREPPALRRTSARGVRGRRRALKEYIRAGDIYQVVPSQRWSAEPPWRLLDLSRPAHDQPEPVHVLPRLRGLRAGRRLARVAVKVSGRRAEQRPIAGTRPRADRRRGGPSSPRSCWPTRRSARST